MPFGVFAPKTLNYLAFQSFYFECTWWRLFWVYLMKVILNVPDECYFECTWRMLFWVYLTNVIPETHRAHYIWHLSFCTQQARYLDSVAKLWHIISTPSHIISTPSHIISTLSHIISTLSHIISTLSHLSLLCFTPARLLLVSLRNLVNTKYKVYGLTRQKSNP